MADALSAAAPAEEKSGAAPMDTDKKEGDGVRFEIRKWNAVCM